MNSRAIVLCIVLVLLVGISFSEYRREITVQVISKDNYVVPNAYVYFVNQLNYIDGKITSRPILSNDSGMATYMLYNNDFDASKMVTKFTVNVNYGNTLKSFEGDVNKTANPMLVQMPLYAVRFTLLNEEGLPASGAFIEATNLRFTADNNGFVFAILPEGKQTISTVYEGIKRTQDIEVRSGSTYTFKIYEYRSKVRIIDSLGNPLSGKLLLGGQELAVPEQGLTVTFGDDVNPVVKMVLNEKQKEATLSMSIGGEVVVSFDNEKPEIENVSTEFSDNVLSVKARVFDPGKYGSGIQDVFLYYETENEDGKQVMYVESLDNYASQVRLKNGTKFIDYKLEAVDKEGNSLIYEGRHRDKDNSTSGNQSGGSSGLPSGSQPLSSAKQGNQLMLVLAALVIIVVAYFIYKKMFS